MSPSVTEITLLDGGIGQELVHRAGDRPTPLWSTQVMMARPDLLAAIHTDYFAAGATVATTNSYAVHRDRLRPAGVEDRFGALHEAAIDAAAHARDRHGSGRVAGSIGPLGATYRPELHPSPDQAVPLYREVATLLAPRVDLILCETIASVDHARSVLAGTIRSGRPVWLSVSVDDEDGTRLRSGEAVAEILPIARDGAAALLANCSAPEAMPAALAVLGRSGLPFGAYANGFVQITKDFLRDAPTVDSLSRRRDLGPEAYAEHALGWIELGATIVGGCCETGPAHIAAVARELRAAGHLIV